MNYFSYGSNMCTRRLHARVPSARFLALGSLKGYQLKFHKRSVDRSGKCTPVYTGDMSDEIYGVIFDIAAPDKPKLDKAEGLGKGYDERQVDITTPTGVIAAYTYVAAPSDIDHSLTLYSWYEGFVVAGTMEHELPLSYIKNLEAVITCEDPDMKRDRENGNLLGYK